ncbi:protein of unknown function [Methylorubrum extorquens]|uniref:Uncharacterized protein n=1 Tax=Methylorubrum extorquens TaxID=408 RepID=A0A2N9AS91_METEX|nr:protein of unknown function [Methylorubrum extorquens]
MAKRLKICRAQSPCALVHRAESSGGFRSNTLIIMTFFGCAQCRCMKVRVRLALSKYNDGAVRQTGYCPRRVRPQIPFIEDGRQPILIDRKIRPSASAPA